MAAGDIRFLPEQYVFVGELALDGTLRPVRGLLPLVAEAKRKKKKAIFVPTENAAEAALVHGIDVYGADSLQQVVAFIRIAFAAKFSLRKGGYGRLVIKS